MSADRTPCRARQCLFRRTFERFPFGRCERKVRARSASSYDVRTDGSQDLQERWTSIDAPGVGAELQNSPQEKMDSSSDVCVDPRKLPLSDPVKNPSPIYLNNESVPSGGFLVNGLGYDPFPHLQLENHANRIGGRSENYAHFNGVVSHASCSSSDSRTVVPSRRATFSSSPSVSSMEMDADVDPETGERALG